MGRLHIRVVICVSTALLLSSGCSGKEAASEAGRSDVVVTTPAPVGTIPEIGSTQGLALPIEAYMLTGDENALVLRARQTLIERCMRGFGLTYSIRLVPPSRTFSLVERRYGVADAATAAEWGYHSPDPAQGERRRALADNNAQTPTELLVLTGWPGGNVLPGATPPAAGRVAGRQIPAGGCQGEAVREITGDDGGYGDDAIVQAINQSTESDSDRRVSDAVERWSECMKRAGYDYPGPMEAIDSFGGPAPSEVERKTAVTDVKCKSETNLIGVWFTVESAYQTAAIQQNREHLASVQNRLKTIIRNATSIAGGTTATEPGNPTSGG
ncbi:hypothetical protein ACI2K4_27595 [Micromonospora sp. NPDC050397]|uniref:hypothetical protein n=1 Tax=Micromonospora sp. NPDC050397 TaxID=3364279 RepID=UPI00384C0D60